MDIRQFENAIRSASEGNPEKSALEALISGGQSLIEMPEELIDAVESLKGRAVDVAQDSILKDISSAWT